MSIVAFNTNEQARAITRHYAKSFYFASHALPPKKRQAAYALYAFCRYVDNIADETTDTVRAGEQMDAARRQLDEVYDADRRISQWATLRDTVERYGIPKKYFLDLIEGVEMDLTAKRCQTFGELKLYCYHVASVVGLMMTKILQPQDDEAYQRAEDLGTAMQLTNILRDVGEDCRMGRVYLVADEMREWGITEAGLHSGTVTPAFRAFMHFQISRAREYYARAEAGIAMLPNDGSRYCVRLMSTLYSRILTIIEANDYDVFSRRAHVPLPSKLYRAGSIALQHRCLPYFLLGRRSRDAIRVSALQRATRSSRASFST